MLFLLLALLFGASINGAAPYTIAGEVRDSNGKPSAGVKIFVTVTDSTLGRPKLTGDLTISDSGGRFFFNLARPGKYLLVYEDRDRGYQAQGLPFFRDPNNPPPEVILDDTTPTAYVLISMSKNGVLKGEAIDAQTQLPIDNVNFAMCHAENRTTCWHTSARSADGTFSIPMPFVPFTLRITSPEFEDWLGLTGSDGTTPVMVPSGTITTVRLLMKRRASAMSSAISEAEKRTGINLPAPKQLPPENDQIFDYYPRRTRLEWEPVEGAVRYSVEVDYCQFKKGSNQCNDPQSLILPGNPSTSNLPTTTCEFQFVGKQPGRWRVWAIDKEGRDGFKSEWRTFVYLK
jgi:hypothetical protein